MEKPLVFLFPLNSPVQAAVFKISLLISLILKFSSSVPTTHCLYLY